MDQKTVLIIEDNALNLKLCRSLLQIRGFGVLEAPDAEQGMEIAKKRCPDLILMDIQLPGMDGLTATRKLKEDETLRQIPVVALTSYAMKGDKSRAMDAGCCGYITKPIDTRNFIIEVEQHLAEGNIMQTLPCGAPGNGKPRILIVDDDPFNVKLLKAKLPSETYDIVTAGNGQDALEEVEKNAPDLILLDVMMPGMDGFETTKRLKAEPKTRNIPIILVTALDGSNYKAVGLEAGADEFLNKPVNTTELRKRVECFLNIQAAERDFSGGGAHFPEAEEKSFVGFKIVDEYWIPHVVLAADEAETRRHMRLFLDDEQYDLICVDTLEALNEKIAQNKADVILADYCDTDVVKYCERAKEQQSTHSIQWLVLIDPQDLESISGEKVGAVDDFLVKPVNVHELRARVTHLARKKRVLDKKNSKSKDDFITAITDKPTGIYNRTYFYYILTNEVKRSERYKQSMALVLVKNRFLVQESAGGTDAYLKEVADVFKKNLREIDFVARYANDTIGLILPYTDHSGAQKAVSRIQTVMSRNEMLTPGNGALIEHRYSIGISAFPEDAESMIELVDKAKSELS